jgi:hypothetical protein
MAIGDIEPRIGATNYVTPGTNLPTVSDPEQAYAAITRGEYLDYIQNFRGFEDQLIQQAQTDTSLIDQARADAPMAAALTQGVASRNASRYGTNLTPAQLQQQQLRLQRANTLGSIQSINDARLAQREANTRLLADLINIGQGVNRTSQNQLGSSAANYRNLQDSYTQAKASSKAQTYQTIGSLGAMAILATAFL